MGSVGMGEYFCFNIDFWPINKIVHGDGNGFSDSHKWLCEFKWLDRWDVLVHKFIAESPKIIKICNSKVSQIRKNSDKSTIM